MANNNSTQSGGIGLMGLLFIVFLVLKLIGVSAVAQWSWWWVTAPLWMPTTLILIGLGIYCICLVVKLIASKK
ncbi:hypothetical protein [Mucilaginibacter sp.]|uniref:hypothetical protein n=1 Tax=Mucilaginibacter sp. TaxID=1882438 RepID=UPI000CB99C95|nr:hypothetical protein [Mucilaginibacter sp.]PLW90009.1 MAG: hypothetical protein C0154_08785 [Mucilaginibacter sp.]PMP65803.1 MAG: hypothetical protein C0191_02775 [Mucilaginibacter sp.]